MTTSELVGILKLCPSMSVRIKAPPKKAFSPYTGPRRSGKTFLCDQAWYGCAFSRLGCLLQRLQVFLLNACSTQYWYNCPWHIAVMHFSSIMFNCSYQKQAYLAYNSFVSDKIWRDEISTSTGRTTSMAQTKEHLWCVTRK